MSNGNPNDPPGLSGKMKTIRIVMTAEDYGTSTKEWQVPEELARPYAIAYDAWISKGGLEISKAIYELALGGESPESVVASAMIGAIDG